MKKFISLTLIVLAFSLINPTVHAMGGGMGGGMPGGMGGNGGLNNFGTTVLDWFQKWHNGEGYTGPSDRDWRHMEEMEKQHYEDSVFLEYQIQMKEKELDAVLKTPDPDIGKVRAILRDIQELRSLADQEQLNYERETVRTGPGARSGSHGPGDSYGASDWNKGSRMGHGNGQGMGAFGQGNN